MSKENPEANQVKCKMLMAMYKSVERQNRHALNGNHLSAEAEKWLQVNLRRYDLAEPSQKNIAKINKLYDEGWRIIYWTARGGSEKSRKAGKCYYDFTWKQLKSWGCKFHDLSTGTKGKCVKPPYDLVVDDKAKRIEEL